MKLVYNKQKWTLGLSTLNVWLETIIEQEKKIRQNIIWTRNTDTGKTMEIMHTLSRQKRIANTVSRLKY